MHFKVNMFFMFSSVEIKDREYGSKHLLLEAPQNILYYSF